MSITLDSVNKINSLKQGIEATTGATYPDLTAGVQALKNGYGKGGKEEQEKSVDITENGTVEILPDEGKTISKAVVNVNVKSAGGNDETIRAIVEGDATEIILPESVKRIGGYRFYQDKTLVNIQGAGITSIGKNTFYYCTNLALTELPAGLINIGEYAFYNCTNLALTELPAGLTCINSYTFYNCTNLALTELPAGLTRIDSYAFYNCANLALTELPAGLINIAANGFSGCTNLKTITFKVKPSTLTATAFNRCSNITTINVPWAEGKVSGAPWGATNATINYNYTGA